jgi:prepilin-type processing-associated H-X9-DG protein
LAARQPGLISGVNILFADGNVKFIKNSVGRLVGNTERDFSGRRSCASDRVRSPDA